MEFKVEIVEHPTRATVPAPVPGNPRKQALLMIDGKSVPLYPHLKAVKLNGKPVAYFDSNLPEPNICGCDISLHDQPYIRGKIMDEVEKQVGRKVNDCLGGDHDKPTIRGNKAPATK